MYMYMHVFRPIYICAAHFRHSIKACAFAMLVLNAVDVIFYVNHLLQVFIRFKLEMGGMHLKKPLTIIKLHTTSPTHCPSVEAECMVDDQVFAGIGEPHNP